MQSVMNNETEQVGLKQLQLFTSYYLRHELWKVKIVYDPYQTKMFI